MPDLSLYLIISACLAAATVVLCRIIDSLSMLAVVWMNRNRPYYRYESKRHSAEGVGIPPVRNRTATA